jgi:hypothetical protein
LTLLFLGGHLVFDQNIELAVAEAKPHGIEFHSPASDESSYGNGQGEILGVYGSKPSAMNNVHVQVTYNVNSLVDPDHFEHLASTHADHIAKEIHKAMRDSWSGLPSILACLTSMVMKDFLGGNAHLLRF